MPIDTTKSIIHQPGWITSGDMERRLYERYKQMYNEVPMISLSEQVKALEEKLANQADTYKRCEQTYITTLNIDREQIAALKIERDNYKTQLCNVTQHNEKLARDLDSSCKDLDRARKDIRDIGAQRDQFEKELLALKKMSCGNAHHWRLEEDNKRIAARFERLETDNKVLRIENESWIASHIALQELKPKYAALAALNLQAIQSKAEIEKRLNEVIDQRETLKKQYESRCNELAACREQIETYDRNNTGITRCKRPGGCCADQGGHVIHCDMTWNGLRGRIHPLERQTDAQGNALVESQQQCEKLKANLAAADQDAIANAEKADGWRNKYNALVAQNQDLQDELKQDYIHQKHEALLIVAFRELSEDLEKAQLDSTKWKAQADAARKKQEQFLELHEALAYLRKASQPVDI